MPDPHRCHMCHRTEAEGARFWRDATRPNGLHASCTDCKAEANRRRAAEWYAKNRRLHIANVQARRKRAAKP